MTDLSHCGFQYQEIQRQLNESYNLARRTNKRTYWNWFSRRFELALVWDTLMCGTDEPKIFNPKKSRRVTNIKRYGVYRNGNNIKVESRNDRRTKLEPGMRCIVDVQYVNERNERVGRRCEFTINEQNLIGDGMLGENIERLYFGKAGKFIKPRMTCGEQIVGVLDVMAVDEDLKTCKFEYENIQKQLLVCYDQAMIATGNKERTKWNSFLSRFELALIWDALCGTDEKNFFQPTQPRRAGNDSRVYRYVISLRYGKPPVFSQNGERPSLMTGTIIVEVKYENSIYGETKRSRELSITENGLNTLLHESSSAQHMRSKIDSIYRNRLFDGPNMSCTESVRDRLDEMIIGTSLDWREIRDSLVADQTEENLKRFIFAIQLATTRTTNPNAENNNSMAVFEGCSVVAPFYPDNTEVRKHFLVFASKLYDHLLAREALYIQPYQHTLEEGENQEILVEKHDKCKSKICYHWRHSFTDERRNNGKNGNEYRLPPEAMGQRFCAIKSVVYVVSCRLCQVRYVGKTKYSLAKRYPDGISVERLHFQNKGHTNAYHILQIVNQINLFKNLGFQNYVSKHPAPLEGVEKLWIDRLLDTSRGDLNRKLNYNYTTRRQNHTAALLASFGQLQ